MEPIIIETVLLKTLMVCLYASPMCYMFTCFSFVFWGYSIAGKRMYILAFAVIQTILGTFEITFMPVFIHQFYFFCVYMLLFIIFFRRKNNNMRLIVPLFAYFVYIFMENVVITFLFTFFSRSQIIGTFLIPALSMYPGVVLFSWLTKRLSSRNIHPGHNILLFMQINKRSSYLLIAFYTLQYFTVTLTVDITVDERVGGTMNPLVLSSIYFCFFLSGMMILVALRAFSKSSNTEVAAVQQSYIHDIERLFTSIRGQRHDFLNHIQVIHSMVSLEKKKELQSYAKEVFTEIQDGNSIVEVGHPLFAVVLENKKIKARSLGIDLKFNITGLERLSYDTKMMNNIHEFAKWLDNVMELLAKFKGSNKWSMELTGSVEGSALHLSIKSPEDLTGFVYEYIIPVETYVIADNIEKRL